MNPNTNADPIKHPTGETLSEYQDTQNAQAPESMQAEEVHEEIARATTEETEPELNTPDIDRYGTNPELGEGAAEEPPSR